MTSLSDDESEFSSSSTPSHVPSQEYHPEARASFLRLPAELKLRILEKRLRLKPNVPDLFSLFHVNRELRHYVQSRFQDALFVESAQQARSLIKFNNWCREKKDPKMNHLVAFEIKVRNLVIENSADPNVQQCSASDLENLLISATYNETKSLTLRRLDYFRLLEGRMHIPHDAVPFVTQGFMQRLCKSALSGKSASFDFSSISPQIVTSIHLSFESLDLPHLVATLTRFRGTLKQLDISTSTLNVNTWESVDIKNLLSKVVKHATNLEEISLPFHVLETMLKELSEDDTHDDSMLAFDDLLASQRLLHVVFTIRDDEVEPQYLDNYGEFSEIFLAHLQHSKFITGKISWGFAVQFPNSHHTPRACEILDFLGKLEDEIRRCTLNLDHTFRLHYWNDWPYEHLFLNDRPDLGRPNFPGK
ncbi:hypothetical protein T439DRAFT_344838 [Meredithblackwellia eburnea MCA 4105]